MNSIILGDILNIEAGIICHQVNCQGVMGAGLALSIKRKYPKAYYDYRDAYNNGELKLGNVIYSFVSDSLIVANLCGQYTYGFIGGNFTSYSALRKCLKNVSEKALCYGHLVYIPYKMGCGLAGGDWRFVFGMINNEIPDAIIVIKEE